MSLLWGILGIEGGNIASHRESMFVFGDDVIFEMSQPWRLFFDSPAKKNLAAITVNFRFMLAKHYPAFCGSCLERHFLWLTDLNYVTPTCFVYEKIAVLHFDRACTEEL